MKKSVTPKKRKTIVKSNVKTIGSHPKSGKYKNKILIDKELPKRFKKGVVLHEKVEANEMETHKNKYSTAHQKANKEEQKKYGRKYYKQEQHAVLSLYDRKLAAARKRKKKK